jgi:gas vesicle protein
MTGRPDVQRKGGVKMSRLQQGVLVGVGISLLVALLILLMRSEEMRRKLSKRFEELQNALPEREQLKQSGQQVTARVSQTASKVKDAAQEAATKVRETGSALGDRVQQSGSRVRQLRQDVVRTTTQAVPSGEQSE